MFGLDLWKLVGGGVAVSVLVGSCVARDWRVEQRGAAKAVAKIEKATDNATQKGKRAAAASSAAGVRGQRDPTTRVD
jgi:hypothetical protein